MLGNLRDASLIFLLCPVMLCLLVPLAVTVGLSYLLLRTRRFLPPKFQLLHLQARRVKDAVDRAGAKVTGALGSVEAQYTQTETLVHDLFQPSKKDQS